jgi:multidrug resistance efflux pump
LIRISLMIVLPLVVAVVALHLYAGSGRYVVTENAYVKANIVAVSADVSGRVVSVNVSDNQVVKPGARLFTIDPLPFRIAVAETDAQLAVIRRDFAQLRFDVREAQAEAAEARERQHFLSQQFEQSYCSSSTSVSRAASPPSAAIPSYPWKSIRAFAAPWRSVNRPRWIWRVPSSLLRQPE